MCNKCKHLPYLNYVEDFLKENLPDRKFTIKLGSLVETVNYSLVFDLQTKIFNLTGLGYVILFEFDLTDAELSRLGLILGGEVPDPITP